MDLEKSSAVEQPRAGPDSAPAHIAPFETLQSVGDKHKLTREELSSRDLVELTSFSHKKDDIDQKIQIASAWPELDPFQDVSTHILDQEALGASRAHLDTLSRELNHARLQREQLEAAVQQFDLQDMTRLRTVAKEVSKRHLSSTDTDLIELALDTVYALDKLLRLLRNHKARHDLTELRLQWESMLCSCWQDLFPLHQDAAEFQEKCDRLADAASSDKSDEAPSAIAERRQLQHKRSLSSCRMAAEAIKLESSRLSLRISSFNSDRVLPTGRLLDLLIDQRQIPEKLIDEQERLEGAVPLAAELEDKASKAASALQFDGARAASNASSRTFEETASQRTANAELTAQDLPAQPLPALQHQVSSSKDRYTEEYPETARVTSHGAITPVKRTGWSKHSESASQATPARSGPNRYRPDPRDKLDVAVGNTINKMAIKVSVVPVDARTPSQRSVSGEFVDLSGRYWVGYPDPRLCYCRILKSHTVMVRVGGGWQELSDFITQHFGHLTDLSAANRSRTPLRPLNNSPVTPRSPWLRSASGPADPAVLANARFKENYKTHATPTALRVVTMPVSSSPTPTFDTPRPSRAQPTPLSRTDACEEPSARGLNKSDSSNSIIMREDR